MEQMELREEIEIIAQSDEPESALFDFDSKVQDVSAATRAIKNTA